MSTSINLSLQKRNAAKHALHSLFSRAEHFGFTHDQMLIERDKIYDKLKECPRWVHAYLNGVWDTLQDNAYQKDLVYGGKINGKFFSTHKNRDDYYEKHGIEPREFAGGGKVTLCGHYWSRTLKPFFTMGERNV